MLFPGLQRQHVPAAADTVYGLAHDAPGKSSHMIHLGCDEAVVGPAVGERIPRGLALADRKLTPVLPRRLENPQRHQVDVGNRHRAGVVGRGSQLGSRFQAAEEIGLGEDHAGGVGRSFGHGRRIGDPA